MVDSGILQPCDHVNDEDITVSGAVWPRFDKEENQPMSEGDDRRSAQRCVKKDDFIVQPLFGIGAEILQIIIH